MASAQLMPVFKRNWRESANYYIDNWLLKLVEAAEDVYALLGSNFVFQQNGGPAHETMRTQKWHSRTLLTRIRGRQTARIKIRWAIACGEQ